MNSSIAMPFSTLDNQLVVLFKPLQNVGDCCLNLTKLQLAVITQVTFDPDMW